MQAPRLGAFATCLVNQEFESMLALAQHAAQHPSGLFVCLDTLG